MRNILKNLTGTFAYKASGANSTDGTIEGYASSWNRDLVGDRIEQGAYTKSILERVATKRVRLLDNHNAWDSLGENLIGMVTKATEDNHGLYIEADFAPTDAAQNIRKLCAAGMLSDFSVGIRIVKDAWEASTNTRLIQECMLREVSIVMDPANPEAVVHAVKSTNQSPHYFPVAPADTPFEPEAAAARFRQWSKNCPAVSAEGFLYYSQEPNGVVDARYPLVDIIENQPMIVPAAVKKALQEITVSGSNLPLSEKSLKDALTPFAQRAGVDVSKLESQNEDVIKAQLAALSVLVNLPLR